mgnify:CR=1 FL=1
MFCACNIRTPIREANGSKTYRLKLWVFEISVNILKTGER